MFALLFFGGVGALAQKTGQLTEVRDSSFSAPVKGAPYSAEEFQVLHYLAKDGVPEREFFQRRKIYRDSEGRVRAESIIPIGLPGGPHRPITLVDQPAGRECFLNIEAKRAHCFFSIPRQAASAPAGRSSGEDLGTKTMWGVHVDGTRTTHQAPDIISEHWFSPELQINLDSRMNNIGSFTNTTITENLRREEPDKRLFEVPADFKIIRETGDRAVIFDGANVTDTVLHSNVQPVYTQDARRDHIEGTVTVSFIVGTDGLPTDLRVEHSLGAGLDDSAVAAIQQWRWDPARVNGKAVPALNNIKVNFHLRPSAK
ncbi:MAG TPA: energy transducer TonB [Bryobacteraceae bacterium]